MATSHRTAVLALLFSMLAAGACTDVDDGSEPTPQDVMDTRADPIDPCRAPSSTILTDESLSGGGTLEANDCYYVRGSVSVRNGTLRIEEGVEVAFLADEDQRPGRLIIEETASLVAIGSQSDPVVFHTRLQDRRDSRGVVIRSGSQDNVIDHALFEHLGADERHTALDVAGGATVSNSEFRDNFGSAVEFHPEARLETFEDNAILGNERAIAAAPGTVQFVDASTTINQNEHNYVDVTFTAIADLDLVATWRPLAAPYLVSGTLRVGGHLTLAPDTRVEFNRDAGIVVEDGGALTIDGTAAQRVLMLARADDDDGWRGLRFNSDDQRNLVRHASIGGAGSVPWNDTDDRAAAIFVGEKFIERGSVTFESTNVFESNGDGLLISEGEVLGCDTITFADIDGEDVRLDGADAAADCTSQN